jgi:DNA polymerase-3 subunit alpha
MMSDINNTNKQKDLIIKRFVRKCPDDPKYKERLEIELELVVKKNFSNYLLQVCEILDLVGDTPHIIRGSSGSSLVCWLLGITSIDPIVNKICFSRFLNSFRNSMPDIDMDFPHNMRKKIFNKIFNKWNNVVRISNYVKYKEKGAIRKALKEMNVKGKIPKEKCNLNYWKDKEKTKELIEKVKLIKGKFKNYSLHCGGIIFFTNPNDMLKYKIKDRQILLDKKDVEQEGFFKIDILSNRGLSQLFKINKKPIDEYNFEDNETFELLGSGNNIGLTFAESPGMRKIFSIIKPKTILDIAKCLALIRPGSSSKNADTINDLDNQIIFDDDAIEYIKNTLNCSEDKADSIRRIYAKGNRFEIGQLELELYGMNQNLDIDTIEAFSSKLINLQKYSFCKSHALSYAYLVYALAYSKQHYTKKFWKSTIKNCHSMYRKWVHVHEAISSGVKITCDDTINDLEHFYKYGFWLGKNFLDSNMYVNLIDEKKLTCEFRGLIATSKYYKKYNNKTKSNELITFITIGYQTQIYIDIIVKGWIKTKYKNVCSGNGKIKLYRDKNYACIYSDEIKFK